MQLIPSLPPRFRVVLSILACAVVALHPERARGAASGLNNIPTADTAPNLTLVLQEYSTFGAQRTPDHTAGFKFGIDPWESSQWRNRAEVGLDSHFAPGDAGPAIFEAKYSTQPNADWPAFGIGVANLAATSGDRKTAGQPFSYGVVSHDFKYLRLHGGYGLQSHHNDSALMGIDKTFQVFSRDLMLRADAIQTDRQHNWAASVGGVYSFCKYFALESWVTQPIHRQPAAVTVKLDFGFKF